MPNDPAMGRVLSGSRLCYTFKALSDLAKHLEDLANSAMEVARHQKTERNRRYHAGVSSGLLMASDIVRDTILAESNMVAPEAATVPQGK